MAPSTLGELSYGSRLPNGVLTNTGDFRNASELLALCRTSLSSSRGRGAKAGEPERLCLPCHVVLPLWLILFILEASTEL